MVEHTISLPGRTWQIGPRSPVAFDASMFVNPAFGDGVTIEVTEGPVEDQGTYHGWVGAVIGVDGVGSLAGLVTCPWCGTMAGSKCLLPPKDLGNFHASRVFEAIRSTDLPERNLPAVYVVMS